MPVKFWFIIADYPFTYNRVNTAIDIGSCLILLMKILIADASWLTPNNKVRGALLML